MSQAKLLQMLGCETEEELADDIHDAMDNTMDVDVGLMDLAKAVASQLLKMAEDEARDASSEFRVAQNKPS